MPNSRRWQQSGARRGCAVHADLQQEAWLRVLQGRRPPSVKWPHARSQQHGQTGSGVATKLGEPSKERQGSPSHHNARSAGLRPFVDANIKKSAEIAASVEHFGRHRGSRSGWVARSIEARRDSSPGRARRQADEGLRGVLVQGASTSGGTRTEEVCSRSQHQCCRAEAGHSEDAARLRATPTTSHQCRGAKITGFGESFTSTSCGPVAKRPCRSAQGRVLVLAIPAELSAWLEERHADLHVALVNGDNVRVLELTSLLSEGAERLVVDRGHVSMRTSARYGLRASRVGEASNPGPPLTRLCRMGRPLDPVEVNSSESESQEFGTRSQIVSTLRGCT